MGTRETYLTILAQHGRRIANRFVYAETREATRGPLGLSMSEFYENVHEMYGDERHLRVEERSRAADPLRRFDPLLMFYLYPDPWARRVIATRGIKGTSRDWAAELPGTEPSVRNGILRLVTGDEQMLDWVAENEDWREFDDSLNEADMLALRMLLLADSPDSGVWPAPGSLAAEAWIKSKRKG